MFHAPGRVSTTMAFYTIFIVRLGTSNFFPISKRLSLLENDCITKSWRRSINKEASKVIVAAENGFLKLSK